jgi:hypothetical protein
MNERTLSLTELTELLRYEELVDEGDDYNKDVERRMKRIMHRYVPARPFKATIRIHRKRKNRRDAMEMDSENADDEKSLISLQEFTGLNADSPASFPPTPFSRARVLGHSAEIFDSMMFAARDRLRLEAQSASRDEYSRSVALNARNNGQFAIFDSKQTSDNIALGCGGHCVTKVGFASCSSARAMVSLTAGIFIYIEYSVTVSSNQVANLAFGFAPPDCPLNVQVGAWPGSIGLCSDGKLMVGSRWFQLPNLTASAFSPGDTIGILIQIPCIISDEDEKEKGYCSDDEDGDQTDGADELCDDDSLILQAEERSKFMYDVFSSEDLDIKGNQRNTRKHDPNNPIFRTVNDNFVSNVNITTFIMKININGSQIEIPQEATHAMEDSLRFLVAGTDINSNICPISLYPTVSLMSNETRVWCRFCEADIVYRRRDSIGAPSACRVYCLDGTLLLKETST